MRRIIAVLISVLVVAGCANVSRGKDFDLSAANKFVAGETSMREVIDVLGPPQQTVRNKEGRTKMIWQYSQTKATLFNYKNGQKLLGVVFDKEGKFLRVSDEVDNNSSQE